MHDGDVALPFVQARALDDMSPVKIVGIDDTSLHKGQSYIVGPAKPLHAA